MNIMDASRCGITENNSPVRDWCTGDRPVSVGKKQGKDGCFPNMDAYSLCRTGVICRLLWTCSMREGCVPFYAFCVDNTCSFITLFFAVYADFSKRI